ncbi:MAG: Hsp20/alpha crystallin family protein [bacterium]|nr:Hsp20/alpha crystallin family protein [bacterium]
MLTTLRRNPRALVARDPFQSLFDSLFGDATTWPPTSNNHAPRVNVSETDAGYELAFELPGLAESDIQVDLHEHTLTVSAERKDTRESQDQDTDASRKWHRVEHQYGRYVRALSLPRDAGEEADAVYENGVLTVTVKKAPEAQTRRIEVRKANG